MPKSKSAPNGARKQTTTPVFQPGAYKLKGAAEYLGGISPLSVRRLCERGLLKPNRQFRHLLFAKSELDMFLSS
jgi:hypothetical protein